MMKKWSVILLAVMGLFSCVSGDDEEAAPAFTTSQLAGEWFAVDTLEQGTYGVCKVKFTEDNKAVAIGYVKTTSLQSVDLSTLANAWGTFSLDDTQLSIQVSDSRTSLVGIGQLNGEIVTLDKDELVVKGDSRSWHFYSLSAFESHYFQAPVVKPYSLEVTATGITAIYTVTGANRVEALYKEQFTDVWNELEASIEGSQVKLTLTDLTYNHYYVIMLVAYNESGRSTTVSSTVQNYYDALKSTYFTQPFLRWGADITSVKRALTDTENTLDSEANYGDKSVLTYRFKYMELKTEYIFDAEQKLVNVLIYFDKERVTTKELERFISGALGYLAYGNIHINMDGEERTFPLYRTAEGSSLVVVYDRGSYAIVDYMDSNTTDTAETINK